MSEAKAIADLLALLTTAGDAASVGQLAALIWLGRAIIRLERRVFAIELKARIHGDADQG